MKSISFQNILPGGVTVLSNDFIDHHMMGANGEFVKIYLCLLRYASDASRKWTYNEMIDQMGYTSKDVRRALSYWTKLGLIACEYDSEKELVSLSFLHPEMAAPSEKAAEKPAEPEEESSEEKASSDAMDTVIPAARLRVLKKDKDAKQILFIAEQYLGHTLTGTEIQTLLYFFDELHFPVSLMDYLLDYCVTNGHKSINYIRAVGFAWFSEGIDDVEKAKAHARAYNKDRAAIMKAYGLGRRNPAATEAQMIDAWLNDYKLSLELILEAVNRTMDQIHEPKFRYTDKILRDWADAGVRSPKDLEKLDEQHAKKAAEKSEKKPAKSAAGTSSRYDIDALERLLVNK